jgi:peptidyl-prolyl cis-trans isomerase C
MDSSKIKVILSALQLLILQTGCDNANKNQAPAQKQTKDKTEVTDQIAGNVVASTKAQDEPTNERAGSTTEDTTEPAQKESPATPDPGSNGNQVDGSKIAAKFSDGTTILQEEVLKKIKTLPQQVQGLPFTQLYNLVLFVMVQEKLAYVYAMKEGFDKRDSVTKDLARLTEGILKQCYLEEESNKSITQAAIDEQYEKLVREFKPEDEFGLRHILLKTRDEALEVIQKLTAGLPFDELQAKYSIDRKNVGPNAILGFFRRSQLPEVATEKIMCTPIGSFVDTPISVPNTGFSVLFVASKRKTEPAPLAMIREKIRRMLQKRYALQLMSDLCVQNNVTMYRPDGSVMPVRDIDTRLAEFRDRQARQDDEPTDEEKKRERSVHELKDSFVVARLGNGTEIVFSELADFIKENLEIFQGLSPYDVYVTALEEYVIRKFLNAQIATTNIGQRPDVVMKVNETSRSYLAKCYLTLSAEQQITDADLRTAYDTYVVAAHDKNELEIKFKMFPVKNKEDGTAALNEIKKGQPFESIMQSFSADRRYNDADGGVGYLSKNQIGMLSPSLYALALRAPNATVLPEPIDVNGQVMVVRIDDKRPVVLPSFEQAKPQLKQRLTSERSLKITLALISASGVSAWGYDDQPLDLSNEKAVAASLGHQQRDL